MHDSRSLFHSRILLQLARAAGEDSAAAWGEGGENERVSASVWRSLGLGRFVCQVAGQAGLVARVRAWEEGFDFVMDGRG